MRPLLLLLLLLLLRLRLRLRLLRPQEPRRKLRMSYSIKSATFMTCMKSQVPISKTSHKKPNAWSATFPRSSMSVRATRWNVLRRACGSRPKSLNSPLVPCLHRTTFLISSSGCFVCPKVILLILLQMRERWILLLAWVQPRLQLKENLFPPLWRLPTKKTSPICRPYIHIHIHIHLLVLRQQTRTRPVRPKRMPLQRDYIVKPCIAYVPNCI